MKSLAPPPYYDEEEGFADYDMPPARMVRLGRIIDDFSLSKSSSCGHRKRHSDKSKDREKAKNKPVNAIGGIYLSIPFLRQPVMD